MPKITLLLHNIRSTHNVGSIFRTAEGFGVERIILSGYTPYSRLSAGDTRLPHIVDKLTRQIHKTALGAEDMVPFDYFDETSFNEFLRNCPLPFIALEQSSRSVLLSEFQPPNELLLLLGEEVDGIDEALLARADSIIEIPMRGHKESFNVSVAAGIALYGLTTSSVGVN